MGGVEGRQCSVRSSATCRRLCSPGRFSQSELEVIRAASGPPLNALRAASTSPLTVSRMPPLLTPPKWMVNPEQPRHSGQLARRTVIFSW